MFEPDCYLEIPFVDLLSWTFGNTDYDLDKPLFINAQDEAEFVSHHQARTYVRKLIAGLRANGLQPGNSVCLHSFNSVYYSLIYLAVIGAGGIFVGSNPAYTTLELTHLFTISNVRFVLTEPDFLDNIISAAGKEGLCRSNIFIFNTKEAVVYPGIKLWTTLLNHGSEDWVSFDDEHLSKSTTAALMSTSGTTGLPKAAEISHYGQVSQSILLYDSQEKPYEVKRLLCLPQFHAFNAPLAHIAPLREGHTTYVMNRYHPEDYLQFLERYQITETTMVNPIVFNLFSLPSSQIKCLSSLRFVWCGGVTLDASVQDKLQGILHSDATVAQVWGMSEIGWVTTVKYDRELENMAGSVGRLLPNMEARILDQSGSDLLTESMPGEILIRGPSLMTSYLNNPSATNETIIDGWLHTGDIGYVKNGYWFVVDRAKELIKVRGWQVSPTELEAVLLGHEMVSDCAVVGVDFGDERGEVPRAWVVLCQRNQGVDTVNGEGRSMQDELKDYLGSRLAKYKALYGGVKIVEKIPRSAPGKILRKVLKEEFNRELRTKEKEITGILMTGEIAR
ncbi:hypothetical protein BGZ60DRAFT_260185 [Tricladium varicosporioides]|nr:hypothetical protein BGZ60DRAFT_260185 [Hymenoscyphus varicosporioides]